MATDQNGRRINLKPGFVWDEKTQSPMPQRLKRAKDQERKLKRQLGARITKEEGRQ